MPFTAGKSPTQSNLMLLKKKSKWWNEKGLVNPIIAISLLQNSIADKWKMNKRRENRLVEEKRSGCKKFKVIIGRGKSRKTDDAIITEGGKRENLQLRSSPYLSQLLIKWVQYSLGALHLWHCFVQSKRIKYQYGGLLPCSKERDLVWV